MNNSYSFKGMTTPVGWSSKEFRIYFQTNKKFATYSPNTHYYFSKRRKKQKTSLQTQKPTETPRKHPPSLRGVIPPSLRKRTQSFYLFAKTKQQHTRSSFEIIFWSKRRMPPVGKLRTVIISGSSLSFVSWKRNLKILLCLGKGMHGTWWLVCIVSILFFEESNQN